MANITIVATGGVRAPCALELVDRFVLDRHSVRILASGNALKFLWPHLLRHPASVPRFFKRFRPQFLEGVAYFLYRIMGVPHIAEGKWADVVVVIPATCNSVGKIAAGINDSFPLQVIRAVPRTKRVIVVPSMNPEMWFDPLFQRNLDLLNTTEKYLVVSPRKGLMASGDQGFGAQASFDDIVGATYRALGLSDVVESIFSGSSPDARPAALSTFDVPKADGSSIVIVESSDEVRTKIVDALAATCPNVSVYPFASPSNALAWTKERQPSILLTELAFPDGSTSRELIESCHRSLGGNRTGVIVTSTKDRIECQAERLAREDIQFLRKPLNVDFTVGMIAGSLAGTVSAAHVKVRKLKAGEMLFREGDPGTEVYVIESGGIRICKDHNGWDKTITFLGRGEIIGEMSFLDRSKRSASAIATEECDLVVLNMDKFRDYLDRQPAWLRRLITTLLTRLRDRTEEFVTRVETSTPENEAEHRKMNA
jgi:FixJ family two-component response regulator